MKYGVFLLVAVTLLLPQSLPADESLQFFYSRDALTVVRAKMASASPLPWLQSGAPAPNPAIKFDIEVRDGATLYHQKGWFNLSGLAENNGVLMAFHTAV